MKYFDEDLIKRMRKMIPSMVAEEMLSVQPLEPDLFSNLLKEAIPEEELIKQGYKPISSFGLMYVKE